MKPVNEIIIKNIKLVKIEHSDQIYIKSYFVTLEKRPIFEMQVWQSFERPEFLKGDNADVLYNSFCFSLRGKPVLDQHDTQIGIIKTAINQSRAYAPLN